MSVTVRRGSCLCGAVQFEATGDPITMTYCHCESCRRWVSAPVMGGCLFNADQIEILEGVDRAIFVQAHEKHWQLEEILL